jgi:hypothetical protein
MIQAARAVTQAGVYISGLVSFDVHFTPESGHSPTRSGCLLWAISGLSAPQRASYSITSSAVRPQARAASVILQTLRVVAFGSVTGMFITTKALRVVRRSSSSIAITAHSRTLLPHKYPRLIEFRDELPKTGTGKIDRQALLQSRRSCRAGSSNTVY